MNNNCRIHKLTSYALFSLAITTTAVANEPAQENPVADSPAVDSKDTQSAATAIEASIEELTNPEPVTPDDENWNWADEGRQDTKSRLDRWANAMNGWFGKPDPQKPASATLRLVLDTHWADDPIEGSTWTVKPRIRGRLRLPVLEDHLSVIIGDEDLDEEALLRENNSAVRLANDTEESNKTFDRKKARDDNASIALRWSQLEDAFGFDADLGVRSGDDLFLKLSTDKTWYEQNNLTVTNHNYYRYGIDSEHTLKAEVNAEYALVSGRFINNNSSIVYRHQDEDEETTWSNELRQVQYFDNNKQLSYGVSAFGYLNNDKPGLNSYGPVVSYRQPFWREWLFLQTDLHYYNDKEEDKSHFPSALIRLEALF